MSTARDATDDALRNENDAAASRPINDEEDDDTEGFFTPDRRQIAGDAGNPNRNSQDASGSVNASGVNASGHHGVSKSFNVHGSTSMQDRSGQLRRETALPLRFVLDRLRHGVDSADLYMDMIIYIPFLILFIFFFLAGRDIEQNFYVLQGMRDRFFLGEFPPVDVQLEVYRTQVLTNDRLWVELDKNYAGIGNRDDYHDWFQYVVIPTLFDAKNPDTSYVFNAPLGQNYALGAVRVRTQRVRADSCDIRSDLYPENRTAMSHVCYGRSKSKNEETASPRCELSNPINGQPLYAYKQCSEVPGAPLSAVEGVYHCGGYMYDIPFNASFNQAKQFAQLMYDGDCPYSDNWATRLVVVEFFLYTPANDVFHAVKLYSEVTASGWWYNQWWFRSFTVWSSNHALQTTVDVVFFIFVLYYWFDFFLLLVRHVKRDGKTVLSYFTQFWNILELANLITFMVVFGFHFSWMSNSANAENLKLPMEDKYPPNLDRLLVLFEGRVYANSVNTMFVFLKLLKYVRLNPRLNVLTRTIAACQQSIFGVLVLFFTIIFGYAITGWTLFGVNVERFRNLGVSISSLVRMLVGDVDYEELRSENRFLAGLFFWTYMILALFLLLNFLIAIISESFAQVSGKAYSTPFEELLLRSFQSIKAFLRPSNIARLAKNCCGQKSEANVLRRVIKKMDEEHLKRQDVLIAAKRERLRQQQLAFEAAGKQDWADFLDDEDDEDDEELQVQVRFDDLPLLMEEEDYNDLTDYYWQYTWEGLMNEYDDAKKSSEEVSKRRMAETVRLGVGKVLGDDLQKIAQLDQALQSVESEVARMLSALEG
jgi:hypothetical protein